MKFNDRIWSLPDEIGILHSRPKFREKKISEGKKHLPPGIGRTEKESLQQWRGKSLTPQGTTVHKICIKKLS